jgi:hypothetical protein
MVKERGGGAVDIEQAGAQLVLLLVLLGALAQLDTGALGQLLQRRAKLQPLTLHQEVEHRARGLAAKAVVALRVGEHIERRRLAVRVERAEANEIAAALAQLHMRRDQLDDIDTLFNLVGDARHTS